MSGVYYRFGRDIDAKKELCLRRMEVQEVFMMEKGEFVGYTATVDPRNGSICEIADCKPPAEDG